ncbi:MAG TPA: type II toxin-antitoxin system RelE/ParE family toxin [Thermoanaerobaculia bacterium]|nr:type II toxin-antitoxin system RelE/ParE family toxin [Thermoanaerobaculia bacterium]
MRPLPLTVAREAEAEASEAADWYEKRSPGLGVAFLVLIEQTLAHIAENPGQFPLVYRDVRRASLKRFPFGIFFRLRKDRIRVLAVMHSSRDPQRWRRRR